MTAGTSGGPAVMSKRGSRGDEGVLARFFNDVFDDVVQLGHDLTSCCSNSREVVPPPLTIAKQQQAVDSMGPARNEPVLTPRKMHDADYAFMQALEQQAVENSIKKSSKNKGKGRRRSSLMVGTNERSSTLTSNNSPEFSGKSSGSSTATTPSPVQSSRPESSVSDKFMEEENKLLNAILEAEKDGETLSLATAYEAIAVYYCNEQARPWKSVEFFVEAWRLYKASKDADREAAFLGVATCCLVKARRYEVAIQMAERRAHLLKSVDSAASNEAQLWALELKRGKAKTGQVKDLLLNLDVERNVAVGEMDSVLRH